LSFQKDAVRKLLQIGLRVAADKEAAKIEATHSVHFRGKLPSF